MTTGPVGISDGFNMTNVTLITRAIAQNGLLLKPSKPLTSVDSMLDGYTNAPKGHVCVCIYRCSAPALAPASSAAPPSPPPPHPHPLTDPPPCRYTTYTLGVHPTDTRGGATTHYFVSFKMTEAWELTAKDFYPSLAPMLSVTLAVRRFNGPACVNGSDASACLAVTSAPTLDSVVAILPQSDLTNVTGGTDYSPEVTTVWTLCASGTTLLGELAKYIPLSPNRFAANVCTDQGAHARLVGSPHEVVTLTIVQKGKIVVQQLALDERGEATVKW